MDEQVEAVGIRLRNEMQKYASSPKKYKDLHLGIAIGLKTSLEMMGESKYALQCIDEAIEALTGGRQGGKSSSAVQMMRQIFK